MNGKLSANAKKANESIPLANLRGQQWEDTEHGPFPDRERGQGACGSLQPQGNFFLGF